MSSSRTKVWAAVLAAVGLAAAIGAWLALAPFGKQPIVNVPEGGSLSREGTRYVELKNRAVALLENANYQAADPLFTELATAGMGEYLGPRDWVIGRLLPLESIDPAKDPDGFGNWLEKAQSAWILEARLENTGPMRQFLSGRIELANQKLESALVRFHQAAGLGPSDPRIWDILYRLQRNSSDAAVREDGENALKSLYDVAPKNLYVLLEWLSMQSRKKDPTIAATLARAKTLLPPFFPANGPPTRASLSRDIDRAAADAAKPDWPAAARAVSSIILAANSAANPAITADRERIQQGLLSYALRDFSQEFYDNYPLERALAPEKVSVQFREIPMTGAAAGLHDVREACFVELNGGRALALLRRGALGVYRQGSHGTQWDEIGSVPLPAGGFEHLLPLPMQGTVSGVAHRDLLIFGPEGVRVLQLAREPIGKSGPLRTAPLGQLENLKNVRSLAACDLDGDGLLDLVVLSSSTPRGPAKLTLWQGRPEGFEDISDRSRVPELERSNSLAAIEWDGNRDWDLIFTGTSGSAFGYLHGTGEGRFQFRELKVSNPVFANATALCSLDADSNGFWDLLAAGPEGVALLLTQTTREGTRKHAEVSVADFAATGMHVFDCDNDGYPDLLAWNGESVRFFRGGPGGVFQAAAEVLPEGLQSISAADSADVDGDGDLDLVAIVPEAGGGGRLVLLQNDGGNANAWLDVELQSQPASTPGSVSKRILPFGFASTLQVKTGAVSQSQLVRGSGTHFGLGRSLPDVLRIGWTTGNVTNVLQPQKNRRIVEPFPQRGQASNAPGPTK